MTEIAKKYNSGIILRFYFIYIYWNRGIGKNSIIFKNLTKSSCGTESLSSSIFYEDHLILRISYVTYI